MAVLLSLSGTTSILLRLQASGGGGVEGSQAEVTREALVSLRVRMSTSALSSDKGPANSTSTSGCSLRKKSLMPSVAFLSSCRVILTVSMPVEDLAMTTNLQIRLAFTFNSTLTKQTNYF